MTTTLSDAEWLAKAEVGIRVFLVTCNHGKAAEAAGIAPETWRAWRKKPEFQALLTLRREQVATVAVEELGALFATARDIHMEAMTGPYDIGTKLKAAAKIMEFVGRTQPSAKDVGPKVPLLDATVSGADASSELRRRRFEDGLEAPLELPPPLDDEENVDF